LMEGRWGKIEGWGKKELEMDKEKGEGESVKRIGPGG
jgi:hypothetical protein